MARVPEFQRRRLASSVVGVPGQDTSGQIIAQGVGQLGQSVAQFGQQELAKERERTLRKQRINDATWTSAQSAEYDFRSTQVFNNFQNEFKDDPLDKQDILRDRLTALGQQLGDNAPSDEAKASFQRMIDTSVGNILSQSVRWEDQQFASVAAMRSEQTAETLNTSALRAASEASIPDLFNQVETSVMSNAELLSSEAMAQQERTMKQGVVNNTIDGMLQQGNIEQAEALLNSKKYDDVLGSDSIKSAQGRINRFKSQQASLQKKLNKLRKDKPWEFVVASGINEGLAPIDFQGDLSDTITQRQLFIDRVKTDHNLGLPLLMPQEVDMLQNFFESSSEPEVAGFLSRFKTSLTNDQALTVSQQLFEKNKASGAALGVADDDAKTAQNVLRGVNLIANKALVTPSDREMQEEFFSKLDRAVRSPEVRGVMFEGVKALYAQKAFSEGITTGVLDTDLLEESMNELVGPVVYEDRNLFRADRLGTLSFRDPDTGQFLESDEFDDVMDDLTFEQVQKTHGDVPRNVNGESIPLEDIQKLGELVVVGDGLYHIIFNLDNSRQFAVDSKGNPFVLDLRQIYQAQKRGS